MRPSKKSEQSNSKIRRRDFLHSGAIISALAIVSPILPTSAMGVEPENSFTPQRAFELEEMTIAQLQEGMKTGRFTARSLVEKYLARSEALDSERKAKGARGALHGIPILIKDNIDTADRMHTTAGSLALVGAKPLKDSFVAQKLREAGAVILGKTNLSEWANIRSSHSSSGWSGRGGQTRNPYVLDRNPCGSSSGSGVAVAANLCAVAVGTETDGSIVCPSSANSIVGIKPTIGIVSRAGIIPIAHSQDTAGPMTRTVRDAAILLSAIAGVDARDEATRASQGKYVADYTQFLDKDG